MLKKLLAYCGINFRILFLTPIPKFRIIFLEFLILCSRLFRSIIVDGKKLLFKKIGLILKKGILCILLVT